MSDVMRPMSEDELVECLRKFCKNASITVEDIKCPKAPFIISVFQSFFSAIQINLDFIYTPPFVVTNAIENIEWYEEILPLISLDVLICYLMQCAGISDISIRDILEPKPKRTKKILNILMSLWRHILIKSSMYENLVEQQQAEIDEKQELLNEIEFANQQMSDYTASIEKREKSVLVDKENQARFDLQVKEKNLLGERYQKLKSKQADYMKKMRELDVQIESQKVRLEELDQKILKSPNRLNAENEELRQQYLETENNIREIQSKSAGQKKQIGILNDFRELLLKSNEIVQDVRSISGQLNEPATTVGLNHAKRKEAELTIKNMLTELEKEEEQKYHHEQWLAKTNLNGKKRVAAIKEIVAMDKQEEGKIESKLECGQQTVAELLELLKFSEETLDKERKQHGVLTSKVAQEYGILKKALLEYPDSVRSAIELEIQKNIDPSVIAKFKEAVGFDDKTM